MNPAPSVERPLHVVVGANGQIGAHLATALEAQGHAVRRVTRLPRVVNITNASMNRTPDSNVEHQAGDIGDIAEARRLCAGASVVYACFGGPQVTWGEQFPRMANGVIAGASDAGARLVYADNLYAYGPHADVLTETTPCKPVGKKPTLRAKIAELMMNAHTRGTLPVAIARASDLYGPGVTNALASRTFFESALAGRTLRLPGDVTAPHTFTYAPDVGAALVRLGTATDSWGESWHVPSAPALSLLELVGRIGELAGKQPKVARVPTFALRALALVNRDVRELLEMSFQWDRPYLVSHAKFTARFGLEPTLLERGLEQTVRWAIARESDAKGEPR